MKPEVIHDIVPNRLLIMIQIKNHSHQTGWFVLNMDKIWLSPGN